MSASRGSNLDQSIRGDLASRGIDDLGKGQLLAQSGDQQGFVAFHEWHIQSRSQGESESWLLRYLDTMTLLLAFMLVMATLAGGVSVKDASTDAMPELAGLGIHGGPGVLSESASNASSPDASSLSRLSADNVTQGLDLNELGADVQILLGERTVNFRINSEILFASGETSLSLRGLETLQRLVLVLKHSPHMITIEGHTDSIPIRSARFPSNWELSSARAASVVRYMQSNGVSSRRLRAIGYADTRPLFDNQTPEHRAVNRRVEIILESFPVASPDTVR